MAENDPYIDLQAVKCAGCGKRKAPGHSFCGKCYYFLVPETRQALYNRETYPEVYAAALARLREMGVKDASKG